MKDIISTVSIIILIIAMVNLMLSVAVYYLFNEYTSVYKTYSWIISGIIAFIILIYYNVSINGHGF